MAFWGYHLMLDCADCDLDKVTSREQIYKFVKDLVPRIDMTAHGEPIIEHLLPEDPKQGYSLMQLITTSNICAHFMDLDGTAYIDIFSCKEFDIKLAEEIVKEYFNPKKIRANFITRDAR